jgi:hypothetical protein
MSIIVDSYRFIDREEAVFLGMKQRRVPGTEVLIHISGVEGCRIAKIYGNAQFINISVNNGRYVIC